MLEFPLISEVENQTLSAEQMNSYTSGLHYLLGRAHGVNVADYINDGTNGDYFSNWHTVYEGYLYLQGWSFAYIFRVLADSAGKTWYCRGQIQCDDGVWRNFYSGSGTGGWDTVQGTANLQALGHLTLGKIYPIRWQCHTSDETYHVYYENIRNAIQLAPSGWVAPPTFTNGVVSDPAKLNAWRTDLQALYAALPLMYPLVQVDGESHNSFSSWLTYADNLIRYRPSHLHLAMRSSCMRNYRIRVSIENALTMSGATVIWTSPDYAGNGTSWRYHSVDVDISGLGLTFGNYYRVHVQAEPTSQTSYDLKVDLLGCCTYNEGTVDASWSNPPNFSHGWTDLSAATLGRLSTDLTLLYSGNEQLWLYCRAVPTSGSDFWSRHAHRYLIYRYDDANDPPEIHYGTNFAEAKALPQGGANKWLTYDLNADDDIPWGTDYYVEDAVAAFESDTVY
jgi:hypothetical protein